MLLRRKGIIALGAEVMVLDVVRSRPCRRAPRRAAGWEFAPAPSSSSSVAFFSSASSAGIVVFQRRDLGHQRLARASSLLFFACADLLRGGVAARLRLLRASRIAARRVSSSANQSLRLGGKPAPRKPAVERLRVVANPSDVVHGQYSQNRGALIASQVRDARAVPDPVRL